MAGNLSFDANDVLVDQTMVCEASRLLVKEKTSIRPYRLGAVLDKEPSTVERLLHLSMLLDALALHEHLFVLSAESPEDAVELELRGLLIEKGIIKEFQTAPYADKICTDLSSFFNSLVLAKEIKSLDDLIKFNKGTLVRESTGGDELTEMIVQAARSFLSGKKPTHYYDENYPSGESLNYLLTSQRTGMRTLQSLAENKSERSRSMFARSDLTDRPFHVLGNELMMDLDVFDSGRPGRGVSHLRTLIYWKISDEARIVLYPSCRRAPQIDLLTDHLRAGISERVYQVIAHAFDSTIEELYADESPKPLFLPPTLAIFLEILSSANNLSDAIDTFRSQFDSIRQSLRKLENSRREAKTIKERIEINEKIVQTLKSLASHYEQTEYGTLETAIGFAELALKPFPNPFDPSRYSKELLLKPLSWIKTWWRDRPLRAVFQLKKRLQSIEGYERLAGSVLGIEFDKRETQLFSSYYNSFLSRYERKPQDSQTSRLVKERGLLE
jgi:hypothetical protein